MARKLYFIKGEPVSIDGRLHIIERHIGINIRLYDYKTGKFQMKKKTEITEANSKSFNEAMKMNYDAFYAIAPLLKNIRKNKKADYKKVASRNKVHFKTIQRWMANFRRNFDFTEINRHTETRRNLKVNRVIEPSLLAKVDSVLKIHFSKRKTFPLRDSCAQLEGYCLNFDIKPLSKASVFRRAKELQYIKN